MQFHKFATAVLATIILSCSSSQRAIVSRSISQSDSSTALVRTGVTEPKSFLLKSRIDSILNDSILSSCFIGVKILSLDDSVVLYERNSNKLFHPASNMKLLTTVTALNLLDNNFEFLTSVFCNHKPSKGILRGNLYIKGRGDPMMTTDDLDSIASALRSHGLRAITGDIVGDIGYFDSLRWGHGWMWDDEPEADEAFISPLTVNGNAVKVRVECGRRVGRAPHVSIEPTTRYLSLTNQAVISYDTTDTPLSVNRPPGTNRIFVQGRIPPGSNELFQISVVKPEFYFLHLLRERLIIDGISIAGKVRIAPTRSDVPLVEYRHPIDSVLAWINKRSDNIGAENLLRVMAAEKLDSPGSAANGLQLVKRYLANEGIDTSTMILADGSGVSWYNVVTPATLVQILQKQYQHKDTFERFYESLSIAGRDGTLKNRMNSTAATENVHAKTGSLTGNNAVSGYVTTADGKLLAFSILCNHFPGEASVLRNVQDEIIELLAAERTLAQ